MPLSTIIKSCFHVDVTVSEDRVTLTVNEMNFSPDCEGFWTEGCLYCRVDVRDGDDAEAPLIGSYCGPRAPPHLTSQGSAMFVQVTSLYGGDVTFTATYSVLSSGKFKHTNYEYLTFPKYSSYPAFFRILFYPENCFLIKKKSAFFNSHTCVF
jgi:hypothetical protein